MLRRHFLKLSLLSLVSMPKIRIGKPRLKKGETKLIRISDIIIDPSLNVRFEPLAPDDSLVKSIRELGMLSPIIVTDQYKLAAGFRRIEAAKILGFKTIKAWCCGSADDNMIYVINLAQNYYRTG